MNKLKLKILLLFLVSTISSYALTSIKIILPKSDKDIRYSYYLDLLKLSLDKTKEKYGEYNFVISREDIARSRLAAYLADGSSKVDIMWTGTNIEREKTMLPVRIPLLKGLKGARLLIINKDKKDFFSRINNINDLKKLTVIQGQEWPDTNILIANGFTVETNPSYDGMFKMIDANRVDFFPRAINEPYDELMLRPELNLMIEEKIMLYYFLPNYFFVNTKKKLLRDRIEAGLKIAIADGSFDKLFYNHPSNEVLKKINFKSMKIFKLSNPFLTEETKKIMDKKEYLLKMDK